MSQEWDSDIGALLDDVLQDKEPEVKAKPDTPAPPQEQEALSSDAPEPTQQESQTDEPPTLASVLSDVDDDVMTGLSGVTKPEDQEYISPEVPDESEEVTTVVSEPSEDDVTAAKLPEIEFSTPVEDDEVVPLPTFTTEELMESIDIRNFGTLVSLTNRRWHAKIKDRKAAKDAADQSGADQSAFEARKRLLVGADEKLKAVHKCIDAARTDHYGMTLPWSTVGINDIGKRAGPRLLPNTLLFDYSAKMGQHKAEMVDALDKFVAAYPTLIAIAQQKLGKAYNESDYPHPDTIRLHFALEFDFDPIPSGGDFQGLQDSQAEKLSAALERKTQTRLENALQGAWAKLYEDVRHAAEVLNNPDAMFHYTLVDRLREHSSNLKHLNVTKDARLEEIRASVKKELTLHDVKDVRKDDALRKRLGEAAATIQADMEGYANGH